ncbi:uncharacterized protein LOC122052236 [Zingiber officinale]|uniref:TmcB/TmcC TPR repeats domain-containing protein n=1 Tax=Zingiber officinale TaxID=94328 RepID=A0A8J5H6E4_ZINOF|nr:uncharacterized protein LOC122052236 [Zingiber officinale]KAG6521600.1 hypothetical protein ZIOFF_018725 [Zingiber officinale]
MSATVLIRTGSFLASPRTDGFHDSGAGDSFLRRSASSLFSPRHRCAAAIHIESEGGKKGPLLRRARSEGDLVGSNLSPLTGPHAPVPEKVAEEEDLEVKWCDIGVSVPAGQVEQTEYAGGGTGKGKNVALGKGDGDRDDNRKVAEYYQQMLQTDPSNPLLLRNYGRFLHEVEGDAVRAEECYGRAILANPGDGELLSMYGNLVWETHRDEERAKTYFDRAVKASPDDCYVLGSYARFLWDAAEEGEDESPAAAAASSSALVEAF